MAELIAPPSNTPLSPVVPSQPMGQQVAPVAVPPADGCSAVAPGNDVVVKRAILYY